MFEGHRVLLCEEEEAGSFGAFDFIFENRKGPM